MSRFVVQVLLALAIVALTTGCHSRSTTAFPQSGSLDTFGARQLAGGGGTTGDNPGLTALVSLGVAGYWNGYGYGGRVSEFRLCVKHLRLNRYTPAGAPKEHALDLKVGDIRLSGDGTFLEAIEIPEGIYTQITMELANDCGTGMSIQVTNDYGTFRTAETVKPKFSGLISVDVSTHELTLGIRTIVNQLRGVRSSSEIKPAMERIPGRIK